MSRRPSKACRLSIGDENAGSDRKPVVETLAVWADQIVCDISRKSERAAAFRYMRGCRTRLAQYSESAGSPSTTPRPDAPRAVLPSAA